ncbi:hypothetical protein C8R44DRAFT_973048 [Mycena epipterygia]|nr:hypothetical protein C8R44DRAFT_973048 [Mycena epipterygia]
MDFRIQQISHLHCGHTSLQLIEKNPTKPGLGPGPDPGGRVGLRIWSSPSPGFQTRPDPNNTKGEYLRVVNVNSTTFSVPDLGRPRQHVIRIGPESAVTARTREYLRDLHTAGRSPAAVTSPGTAAATQPPGSRFNSKPPHRRFMVVSTSHTWDTPFHCHWYRSRALSTSSLYALRLETDISLIHTTPSGLSALDSAPLSASVQAVPAHPSPACTHPRLDFPQNSRRRRIST